MMHILITGKNSYVGTSLEKWLMEESDKYRVDTIDMQIESWKNSSFAKYDVVFHVAGIAHSDMKKVSEEQKKEYYKVNTDLAIEVAKKAKEEGIKQFIFMSSAIVYGDSSPIGVSKIITENTIPQPKNFYGDTKLKAEEGIRTLIDNNFKVCIIRSPMIYGKGSKGNYSILSKWAVRLLIFPNIKNNRSMIYIDNLCEFIKLMIDNEEGGIFFPQNKEYVQTADMVSIIAKVNGKQIMLTTLFNPLIKLFGKHIKVLNKVFGNLVYAKNLSKYKQEYALVDFKDSIMRTEK
jgi:nucleoside-diphosphate-sugar epimerase